MSSRIVILDFGLPIADFIFSNFTSSKPFPRTVATATRPEHLWMFIIDNFQIFRQIGFIELNGFIGLA